MAITGIHTFMLTSRLNYEKYRALKMLFQNHVLKKRENNGESYLKSSYFRSLGYYGITARLYMQNGFARIELIINPSDLLMGEYTHTQLFTDSRNVGFLLDTVSTAIRNIDMQLYDFTASRFDICTNITLPPEAVGTYISIGRKSYRRIAVSEKIFTDSTDNEHSLTLVSPDFELEIYDKEYEIARRSKLTAEPDFGNILRIEARIKRNMIRRQCCQSIDELLKTCIDDGADIIEECIGRCFDYGDYMSMQRAYALVSSSGYNRRTKDRMLSMLKSRALINKAYDDLKCSEEMSDKAVSRLRNKLEKLCLSPIIIPVRDVKLVGGYLPCFVKLLY